MGTLMTLLVGGLVVGYAAYSLMKVVKSTKAGRCSGCGSCPGASSCSEKHSR